MSEQTSLLELGSYKLKKCRIGNVLFNQEDKFVGKTFDHYGEFCPGESQVFQTFISKGNVVVDAGANIGASTIEFAKIVGKEGFVHSFEPQPFVFYTLCSNLLFNELHNVKPYLAGLGETRDKMIALDLNSEQGYDSFIASVSLIKKDSFKTTFEKDQQIVYSEGRPYKGKGVETDIIPIDELKLDRCDFIKIDVEGMEEQVIKGAKRTIIQHRPVLYVECNQMLSMKEDSLKHNPNAEKSLEGLVKLLFQLKYNILYHKSAIVEYSNNYFSNPKCCWPDVEGRTPIAPNFLCLPQDKDFKHIDFSHFKSITQVTKFLMNYFKFTGNRP